MKKFTRNIRRNLIIYGVALLHISLVAFVDANIKGRVIAHYQNDWARVPRFWKSTEGYYEPVLILVFGVLPAIFIARKLRSWRYLVMLVIWGVMGLESFLYWQFIALGKINQHAFWEITQLGESGLVELFEYPDQAAWMNRFLPLVWLSGGTPVTRQGVILGVLLSALINLALIVIP